MTFWDHLEELRGTLLRIAVALLLCAVAAFCFKDTLFAVILAPKSPDFITYRLLNSPFTIHHTQLQNIELAQQFIIHVKMSLWAAAIVVIPYILFLLFRFVSPALYSSERRVTIRALIAGYLLFAIGLLLAYFVIFPFTFRFLANYQVSPDIPNVISLSSYISVFIMLLLVMGIVFELPVLCWLLGKVGLLSASSMRRYRRHAIVAILILSAIITPTGDAFTLSVVALPIYLLYELSILLVHRS